MAELSLFKLAYNINTSPVCLLVAVNRCFRFVIFLFQSLDATLYLIQSVAEYVEPNEESFIPAILSLLPRLPAHSYVSQTALLMVGMCV